MSPSVEISPITFKRLQAHAVPLVDDIESVMNRVLDYYEARSGIPSPVSEPKRRDNSRDFPPSAPPDLTHTKISEVEFCDRLLEHSQLNWNSLLVAVIEEAKSMVKSSSEFKRLVIVNYVDREKSDEGYRFLPRAGISVQGQDANKSWKAVYHIVKQLGLQINVTFTWRQKEGAAFPGVTGRFSMP